MLEAQRDDPNQTGLVIINSFDYELDEIKDDMIDRRIYAEVFEIDRLQSHERLEYLNCFQEMYQTKQMPMIFIKDQFIGDYSALKNRFTT